MLITGEHYDNIMNLSQKTFSHLIRSDLKYFHHSLLNKYCIIPYHNTTDIQISVVAFITLYPQSAKALRLKLKVEKEMDPLNEMPSPKRSEHL